MDSRGVMSGVIEFSRPPEQLATFVQALDEALRALNTDYDAKRTKDIAVTRPIVHMVERGVFRAWMKQRGKLGGQNKVPRLSNDRQYVDDILAMVSEAGADNIKTLR